MQFAAKYVPAGQLFWGYSLIRLSQKSAPNVISFAENVSQKLARELALSLAAK